MSYITSPNMNLTIPTVGQEAGPDYALDINASLVLIDAHDHTPGKGAAITSGSLNINADLSFNNHAAVSLKGIQLTSQVITPTVNTIYESGSDLYFVDAIGNNIRLTLNGAVAGTPGSISNLVAPASAAYIAGSSVFVWQSNIGKAADMDFGSAIMRNLSPNSTFSMTLAPPAAMTSNTTITLPVIPAVESFMTMDNSGQIKVGIPRDAGIDTINIAPNAIVTSKIADLNVTTAKLADGSVTAAKLAAGANKTLQSQTFTSNGSFIVPAGVTALIVTGSGGGGGGGQGVIQNTNTGDYFALAGAGGGAGMLGYYYLTVTPGQSLNIIIGAGGQTNAPGLPSYAGVTAYFEGGGSGYGGGGGASNGASSAYGVGGTPGSNGQLHLSSPTTGGGGGISAGGGGGGATLFNSFDNPQAAFGGPGGPGIIIITWLA